MVDDVFDVQRLSADDTGAMALAVSVGVLGVYLRNALAAGERDGLVFRRDGRTLGVAWFGVRGNLVLVADPLLEAHGAAVAREVRGARWPWRIAMGPAPLVDALREPTGRPPLVHRDQIYYVGDRDTAVRARVRDDVRLAVPADRDRLARATLELNSSDLNIPPARVDRRWLYDTIDERIREGTTRVLGPDGGIWCKLDFGSDGPGGLVIEGVYTFPERRGRGLGAELVASVMAGADALCVLHVGEHNRPARRAYEHAGMVAAGRCRLLLTA